MSAGAGEQHLGGFRAEIDGRGRGRTTGRRRLLEGHPAVEGRARVRGDGAGPDPPEARPRVARVEGHDDLGRDPCQAPPELVVRDVGHALRATVVGDQRLVDSIRLVAAGVRDLGPVAGVVEVDDVVRRGLVHELVDRLEDPGPGRRAVDEHRDVVPGEGVAGEEDPADQLDVVHRPVEIPELPGLVLVDPDEQCPPVGGRRALDGEAPEGHAERERGPGRHGSPSGRSVTQSFRASMT